MNAIPEICGMKNQTPHGADTVSGIFVLLVAGLLTTGLLLLKYVNVLTLDLELVLAPFVVIGLLTYGDKLLIGLFLGPISFVAKLVEKGRGSQSQQQQYMLKQS